MPVVDIEYVCDDTERAVPDATALASAIGRALGTPAGRTWVRVRKLDALSYAENDVTVLPDDWPVFVTILHAHPPTSYALVDEVKMLTETVASCMGCAGERVHVQYAPAAAGRQAFGGKLVE